MDGCRGRGRERARVVVGSATGKAGGVEPDLFP
jgi:hypothetical protein